METQTYQPPQKKPKLDEIDDSEKSFHLEQAKLRSRIRIEQGRESLFDLVLQILMIYHREVNFKDTSQQKLPKQIREPYLYIQGQNYSSLENLKASIELHCELETDPKRLEYWKALLKIVKIELQPESNTLFEDEIDSIVEGKNESELQNLKSQVKDTLSKGCSNEEFWKKVLQTIKLCRAKCVLRRHAEEFTSKFENKSELPNQVRLEVSDLTLTKDINEKAFGDGKLSPELQSSDEEDHWSPEQDIHNYSTQRKQTLESLVKEYLESFSNFKEKQLIESTRFSLQEHERISSLGTTKSVEDIMRAELLKQEPLQEEDSEFSEVVDLKPIFQNWQNRFRPRKPKYFNRVKTGYEWTKHNQAHYDHFNPPPKVVQGYKFNVFYPDLIDKTKSPQFYLEPDNNKDTCIIRFHAGPPYEDIAFRVVNREWDFSERNGFKCLFDKGILHLYFNFKRHRYKR